MPESLLPCALLQHCQLMKGKNIFKRKERKVLKRCFVLLFQKSKKYVQMVNIVLAYKRKINMSKNVQKHISLKFQSYILKQL